jgi:hypothetical protein
MRADPVDERFLRELAGCILEHREDAMTRMMEALIDRLCFVHEEARKVVEAMPAEALDWVPGPGMNSVCVMVVHMLGAERYYVGDLACGDQLGRDRDAEFRTSGLGTEKLLERLNQADTYAERVLGELDPDGLETMHFSPRLGRDVSAAWAVLHAIEHSALHLGHLQLTRQLWEESRKAEAPKVV